MLRANTGGGEIFAFRYAAVKWQYGVAILLGLRTTTTGACILCAHFRPAFLAQSTGVRFKLTSPSLPLSLSIPLSLFLSFSISMCVSFSLSFTLTLSLSLYIIYGHEFFLRRPPSSQQRVEFFIVHTVCAAYVL